MPNLYRCGGKTKDTSILFDNGYFNKELTGGFNYASTSPPVFVHMCNSEGVLHVNGSTKTITTNLAIDFTKYTKLKFTYHCHNTWTGAYVGYTSSLGGAVTSATGLQVTATIGNTVTYEINISSITGAKYVGITLGTLVGSFTKIWLE